MGPSTLIDGDDTGSSAPSSVTRLTLQWGRRLSSTETHGGKLPRGELGQASMGPSTLIDGDSPCWVSMQLIATRFNGAVDSHRRRPPTVSCSLASSWRFNGAVDSHRR